MEGLVHDSMPEGPCVPILGCLCFLPAVEMRKTSSTSSFSVGSPVSLTSDSALSAAVRVCNESADIHMYVHTCVRTYVCIDCCLMHAVCVRTLLCRMSMGLC